jgi:hypothetical protein
VRKDDNTVELTNAWGNFQANNAFGGTQKNLTKDWGLGGLLIMGDADDGKKAGTMLWGGYPNLIWVS